MAVEETHLRKWETKYRRGVIGNPRNTTSKHTTEQREEANNGSNLGLKSDPKFGSYVVWYFGFSHTQHEMRW